MRKMRNVLFLSTLLFAVGCEESPTPIARVAEMKIQIYGSCTAFEKDSEEPTADASLLRKLDGHEYRDDDEDDCFGFWLIDESDGSPIKNAGISGGYLSFAFDENSGDLIASVEYRLDRALTALEIDELVRYTTGQCSDGIGENFMQMGCEMFPIDVAPMTGAVRYSRMGF